MLANAQIAFLQRINPDLKRVTRTDFCPHIGAYFTAFDLVQYTQAIGIHATLLEKTGGLPVRLPTQNDIP